MSTYNFDGTKNQRFELAKMDNLAEELDRKRSRLEKQCYAQLNQVLLEKKRIKKLKSNFFRDQDLQDSIYNYNNTKEKETSLRKVYLEKTEKLKALENQIIESKLLSNNFRKRW